MEAGSRKGAGFFVFREILYPIRKFYFEQKE